MYNNENDEEETVQLQTFPRKTYVISLQWFYWLADFVGIFGSIMYDAFIYLCT